MGYNFIGLENYFRDCKDAFRKKRENVFGKKQRSFFGYKMARRGKT